MGKLKVGDEAPDFELKDQDGNTIKFSDLKGKYPVVLFFYPKDKSYGCTREACTFRDSMSEFNELNAKVFGISSDSVETHKSFAEQQKLTFPLLSDVGGKVRKLYGVPSTMFIMPGRCTYVIGPDGIVRHIYSSQVNFANHVSEAKTALEKIRANAETAEE
ncbi:Peroxiredoxin Q, chloroplastic [Galdieria sulphuraria]|uniref:thioredoxin-dependent peroxiredoxin n=1 Tax=Galdieria sulphuraria TaxID=130081 RepID=M2XYS7_GALSU|nr:peroxiredoxin Q/BCP [Galdieria sulphuraria]EME28823.1 peroxiredoxin Q/BCP [Galdieria sulphuraria]GJD11178.1 Peroxiredoxin Q, chloroplastic [Galdieria sulphuraria]|eukprot:XP_005705343.1 peroxiredoxin Q/BCP [Galdieria sulphuraria]